jgi:hypothetical protein
MLYVPLFFYLFESLTERLGERKKEHAVPRKEGGPPVPAHEAGESHAGGH